MRLTHHLHNLTHHLRTVIYIAVITPVRVGFGDVRALQEGDFWTVMDWFMDIFFVIDLISTFFTAIDLTGV